MKCLGIIEDGYMKLDREQLMYLQTIMQELSNGVDPTSGITFEKDTVLNNITLKKAFAATSELLKGLARSEKVFASSKAGEGYKMQFHLFPSDVERIEVSETPITISKLAFLINSVGNNSGMKRLKATQITFWLTCNGYLQIEDSDEEHPYKIPTEAGVALGISYEIKRNAAGVKYAVNYYSPKAQKYIISNINQITGYYN